MPADRYGIIVEGKYDSAVYEELILRIASHAVRISSRFCEGRSRLIERFPGLLEAFRYAGTGGPIDMAIVIADADGQNPIEFERRLRSKIEGRDYPFIVHFHAVQHAMEAWLLADVDAFNRVAMRRTGRRIGSSHQRPEDVLDPKRMLRELLAYVKIPYTSVVGAEIAAEIDLRILDERCSRFRLFAELVDC